MDGTSVVTALSAGLSMAVLHVIEKRKARMEEEDEESKKAC